MKAANTLSPLTRSDMRSCAQPYTGRHEFRKVLQAPALAVLVALSAPRPAHAVDGCLVLLCFAAPSWSAIAQCVAPIKQVLHDLARGRPFPTCGMSGPGNSAVHQWAESPAFCPPQYTIVAEGESGPIYSCVYLGAVSVAINGAPFARTWWNMGGNTVTDFSPEAKAQLGAWDTRFDDDYAAWLAAQPPVAPPPPCHDC
jgi:hypothetical protein